MNRDATGILTRHPANPILHVKDYPGIAQLYNPSAVQYGDETVLLVSVVEHAATRGVGRDVGQTRIARSRDGVHFDLSDDDFISTQSDEYPYPLYHHFIDNRVTKIDEWYYIVTPVMVNGYDGPVGMLGRTKDFESYERIDVITQPKNRGASLFPERIGGAYYYIGALLLDLDEPWRVIGRTNSYILAPEEEYERHGNCDNTVFVCGAIADHEADELRAYYGATDNYICLATGRLSELVQACVDGI